jgi:hypothetical protein
MKLLLRGLLLVAAGAVVGGLAGTASGVYAIRDIADSMSREHGWVCGTGFPMIMAAHVLLGAVVGSSSAIVGRILLRRFGKQKSV